MTGDLSPSGSLPGLPPTAPYFAAPVNAGSDAGFRRACCDGGYDSGCGGAIVRERGAVAVIPNSKTARPFPPDSLMPSREGAPAMNS